MTRTAPGIRSALNGARRLAFLAPAILLSALTGGCGSATPDETAAAPGPTGIRYLAAGSAAADGGFARAVAPRPFRFPADHASHPAFRTEWWYFTGNLTDSQADHFGFELTVFRIALTANAEPRRSDLAANQIWMANLAVTDTAAKRFQAAERLSRGAPGLAGITRPGAAGPDTAADAGAAGRPIVIGVEDWAVTIDGASVRLRAEDEGFGIDLALTGLDRIVAQGDAGLDRKGPEAGNASYYYSAPRLAVTGTVRSAGRDPVGVTGSAWMDREWSTSALSGDAVGWDWFALQLDDGSDLMFYRLRGSDGSTSPFSGGTLTDAAGRVTRLGADDVELEIRDYWTSERTGVRYPVAWRLAIPTEALDLTISPQIDSQEIDLTVRYWEGAVVASGRRAAAPIGGIGYLELAGY